MSMIEELKQRRLQLKLSQDQVAATMGTTQSALSRAERGGNPTQDFLQRYDDALRSLSASGTGGTGDPSGNGSKGSNGNMSVETRSEDARNSTVEIATIRFIIGKIARKYGLSEVYVYDPRRGAKPMPIRISICFIGPQRAAAST